MTVNDWQVAHVQFAAFEVTVPTYVPPMVMLSEAGAEHVNP